MQDNILIRDSKAGQKTGCYDKKRLNTDNGYKSRIEAIFVGVTLQVIS